MKYTVGQTVVITGRKGHPKHLFPVTTQCKVVRQINDNTYMVQRTGPDTVFQPCQIVNVCDFSPIESTDLGPEPKLKDGDRVYHKNICQFLTVLADEKGPAYTGKDYEDDEISLSYAEAEMKRGALELIRTDLGPDGEGGTIMPFESVAGDVNEIRSRYKSQQP